MGGGGGHIAASSAAEKPPTQGQHGGSASPHSPSTSPPSTHARMKERGTRLLDGGPAEGHVARELLHRQRLARQRSLVDLRAGGRASRAVDARPALSLPSLRPASWLALHMPPPGPAGSGAATPAPTCSGVSSPSPSDRILTSAGTMSPRRMMMMSPGTCLFDF